MHKDGKKARMASIIFYCFSTPSFISMIPFNPSITPMRNGIAVKLLREVN